MKVIYGRNFQGKSLEQFAENFVPLYRCGRRDLVCVARATQCTPEICKAMVKAGRIYIGGEACRVEDVAGATRCFKCREYVT